MKQFLMIILASLCSASLVHAQTAQPGPGDDLLQSLQEAGRNSPVSLELDSMLASNYYKLLTINKKNSGIPGYRIRIYSESGLGAKEEQQRVKARFLTLYPEIDAYIRYDEPYFKVYVGDCRTMSEALKLFDRIKYNFPNPIIREDFIVPKNAD